MPEMLKPTSAIMGAGMGNDVALITDGRFSGGTHGFVVGHITPEAYEGGALAIVKNGDTITIDAVSNSIVLEISDAEMEKRRKAWTPPAPHPGAERGWVALHLAHVQQADKGCDLDVLVGKPSGARAPA